MYTLLHNESLIQNIVVDYKPFMRDGYVVSNFIQVSLSTQC